MTQNSLKFTSSAVTDRGLSEKRPQNEDSYLEMPECGLFSVADGVGGAQAGDVASQMAMEILGEAFTNLPEGGDVEELMHVAITRANGAIYQMSTDLPQLSTMATTIVALHIAGNIATIGHAGDSRIYRLDSRGNLFRETQDHSVVEEEVRAGRMTREQAEHHPSKNVISRALGAESTVEIDMKTIMFEPNTAFLLCSDGITRHIPDTELRDLLASPDAPVTICQQMKEICYSRGAEDNLTAVLIKIDGASASPTVDDDLEENTIATARPTTESEAKHFFPIHKPKNMMIFQPIIYRLWTMIIKHNKSSMLNILQFPKKLLIIMPSVWSKKSRLKLSHRLKRLHPLKLINHLTIMMNRKAGADF